MFDEIIDSPDLARYIVSFETGQIIFLEGDDSQDLYILVSGHVGIFKGDTKIREISESGALFGEMSFFMGAKRTASVKAGSHVRAIRIPKEEVTDFLNEFPGVAREITKHLAHWLDETSQILHGLKAFCDQLPDAVILADRDGKVLTWNTAAEKLYGRDWQLMRYTSVEEIYEEPDVYKDFLKEVQSKYSVREKVLKVKNPQRGTRYISTSTTILYDGHHNFRGVLSLGRDVTAAKKMERGYKRALSWIIPSLTLTAILAVAILLGFPYFSKGFQTVGVGRHELKNVLGKDYLLLKSLIIDPMYTDDRPREREIMEEFFHVQESSAIPYTGLILLDKDKRVVNAYSVVKGADAERMIGSSYTGIEFRGSENSLHKVLTVYRVDKGHPMGRKGIEVSFELYKGDLLIGWLVFQLDVDVLRRDYGVNEEDLQQFHFEKS